MFKTNITPGWSVCATQFCKRPGKAQKDPLLDGWCRGRNQVPLPGQKQAWLLMYGMEMNAVQIVDLSLAPMWRDVVCIEGTGPFESRDKFRGLAPSGMGGNWPLLRVRGRTMLKEAGRPTPDSRLPLAFQPAIQVVLKSITRKCKNP